MTAQKLRWDNVSKIAAHLGVTKSCVNQYLYHHLTREGKVDLAVTGDEETLDWLRVKLQEHDAQKPRVYNSTDLVVTPEDQLRVAMWFIRKIGSASQARMALDIAAQATEKLERKRNG